MHDEYALEMESSKDAFRGAEREDDEYALRWEAIERLPTYSRMRRSLLVDAQGKSSEVDIKKLSLTERKVLLERLVKIAQEDNDKFLFKLKERINR